MNKLIWLDLEMTGLNPSKNSIIEIATIITDDNLNLIAEGPNLIINQPVKTMSSMDEWNTSQHQKSGLTTAVLNSTITLPQAEEETLSFLTKIVNPNTSPICGNSIGQDRLFLKKYMPKLEQFFHYRSLDVSSIKIIMQAWHKDVPAYEKNNNNHRALDDVKESIEECLYYKEIIKQWKNDETNFN